MVYFSAPGGRILVAISRRYLRFDDDEDYE